MIHPESNQLPFSSPKEEATSSISTELDSETEVLTQEKAREFRQKQAEKVQMSAKRMKLNEADVFYDPPSDALALPSAEPVSKSLTPADEWASQIIRLAESGQFDKMNQELKQFTAAYPDYPIYEQLKSYLQ